MKKHPAYMIGFLAIVGIICATLLSVVNAITYPIILENEFKSLNATLSALDVQVTEDLTEELEKDKNMLDGVNNVYAGVHADSTNCYVFEVNANNNFTSFKVLVVISKEDGKILTLSTVGESGFTTHGKDSLFKGNDFGLTNSTSSSLDANFISVSGATVSSDSILVAVKLAYKQLEVLGGK